MLALRDGVLGTGQSVLALRIDVIDDYHLIHEEGKWQENSTEGHLPYALDTVKHSHSLLTWDGRTWRFWKPGRISCSKSNLAYGKFSRRLRAFPHLPIRRIVLHTSL